MPEDQTLETYRALRDTIKHVTGDEPVRSVLFVDVDRGSQSVVAKRVARTFQDANDRCVLIDANLRDGAGGSVGLSDLIVDPNRDISADSVDGLARIGPGSVANPDLLASRDFEPALARIVEQHDYAIVTCNGYPASGDAVAIGPVVDAVILVISAGVTGREPAIRARDALERVGARILGMVVIERPRRWF